ncbi:hypothetical protein DPEC_G00275150 [Dallia pectoralis]|uniref:Uncharacterized protein n=1 Tax=Dallia pectoralis TaxID=75939 RepID=A0ACC2FL66_DALPE|nr:hypothetical protein DPEC_G00275150 [Dallia pectoralis]
MYSLLRDELAPLGNHQKGTEGIKEISAIYWTITVENNRVCLAFHFLVRRGKTSMVRQGVGRLFLILACLSLALHLFLALFCLSVLQTSCLLPPTSSSFSSSSLSGATPLDRPAGVSHRPPPSRQSVVTTRPAPADPGASVSTTDETGKNRKLIGARTATDVSRRVYSHSKLEALFSHQLYNLPRPQMLEDDWLLKLKPKKKREEEDGTEEEEESDESSEDSEWQSESKEDGYDQANWTSSTETQPPWLRYHLGIWRWELYDRADTNVAEVIKQMATQRILSAVQKTGGTQLKLILSFPNYGQALLKPMRQERDAETDVNLFYFSDFERHNAEIAAFHLDRVLDFNRIPPVVGRLINITAEIRDITTDRKLSRTFYTSPAGNVCFHGQCEYYCTTENPVCGQPQVLEVSLASMLPDLSLAPRRTWRSPWRRSYSRTKLAPPRASVSTTDETGKNRKLIGARTATDVSRRVYSHSKLEALFSHQLYNLPRPQMLEDDWLLKLKPKKKREEEDGTEEEEESDESSEDSEWQSESKEDGYDQANWTSSTETQPPWLRYHLGIWRWELYDRADTNVAEVIKQMATQRILSAVQKTGGTQLKLILSFPNYGQALLKPMRQERDAETDVNLFYFSDFERHNAEIAAFHLDRVLDFNRIPPVVGRLINITAEIRDITTDRKLSRTFYTSPAGNVCFHGQCEYYCTTENPVCGQPQVLEVSLASMLPDLSLAPRRTWRSPWRRSYSRTKLAPWEKDPDYCVKVKQTPPYSQGTRLVDFIDMVILDFLMSNMDRHHYETFEKFGNDTFLLHLDNGRAFGRHSVDEPSILAPLRMCCRIRRSTLMRLRLLSLPKYRLSDVMTESLSRDPLGAVAPLLSKPHLTALDRRLATVLQAVNGCMEHHDDVVHNDLAENLAHGAHEE